jgi:hypothetical protein
MLELDLKLVQIALARFHLSSESFKLLLHPSQLFTSPSRLGTSDTQFNLKVNRGRLLSTYFPHAEL